MMRELVVMLITAMLFSVGCGDLSTADDGDNGNTANSGNTGDSADTANTGDTADSGNTGGELSCAEIFTCIMGCGDSEAQCMQDCYDSGSDQGKSDYATLASCIQTNCPEGDMTCIQNNCGNEYDTCGLSS